SPILRDIATSTPEPWHTVPSLPIAPPVTGYPELAGWRDEPGAGHPGEVSSALVPVPVPLDPTGVGARGQRPRPLGDQRRRSLIEALRIAAGSGRLKRLMGRALLRRRGRATISL